MADALVDTDECDHVELTLHDVDTAAAAAWRWGAVEVSLPGGAAAALYALMAAATLWDACRKPKKTLTLPR